MSFDREKLREELIRDEGVKFEIYNDHLGYPTFGIGHLVTEDDEEHLTYHGYCSRECASDDGYGNYQE